MRNPIEIRLINRKRGVSTTLANHILYYPTPVTLNYAWSFGSLVGLFFSIQLLTGIFLAMHYNSHIDFAFESVVHIMTDVYNGYLIRYMHANGASMIFILLYIHMARGLFFRSYIGNRKYLWWSGVILFLLMMATAFIGYVLPWGQMSFWGATVITSLVTAVPVVGENIAYWVWGGFSVNSATLNRFFSLHYLLPFIITGLILLHLMLLHWVGSTNPTQQPANGSNVIPFHPYFTVKDSFIFTVALMIFMIIVTYYPNVLGHSDNFIPANPLVTPAHIVPEWYFTPFYAILRACPNKLGGVIGMLSAILVLMVLPFIKVSDQAIPPIKSPVYKVAFSLFVANFMILMFLGGQPAAAPFVVSSKIFTATYFYYLVGFIPTYNVLCLREKQKKEPRLVSRIPAILGKTYAITCIYIAFVWFVRLSTKEGEERLCKTFETIINNKILFTLSFTFILIFWLFAVYKVFTLPQKATMTIRTSFHLFKDIKVRWGFTFLAITSIFWRVISVGYSHNFFSSLNDDYFELIGIALIFLVVLVWTMFFVIGASIESFQKKRMNKIILKYNDFVKKYKIMIKKDKIAEMIKKNKKYKALQKYSKIVRKRKLDKYNKQWKFFK